MINWIINKILGTVNERHLRVLREMAVQVNGWEEKFQAMSDAELRAMTGDFRERIKHYMEVEAQGAGDSRERQAIENRILREIRAEVFAVVREASRRVTGMRHFDVQLVGGAVLDENKIAEMTTGEGKTLVATLAAYLNALSGQGVHVVTVNDYLARRDREWMGPIYEFLGLSVGTIQHDMMPQDRRVAYASDITYGTNNEFGFDYLRDNMAIRVEDRVQRQLHFAIVDEVDSILVDEARTPLIISGPAEASTEHYYQINKLVPRLEAETHFTLDEKSKNISLTDEGIVRVEELLGIDSLYDMQHMELAHHVVAGLRAHYLFKLDVDYMIKDGEVVIVDEFTGRLMPGRRWSDGLHQAIEAKEGVTIARENQTLATITFQNYFRMYDKLAGMTGTAMTEATEFKQIYNLDVVEIPTNRPLVRKAYSDVIYRTRKEKFDAVVREIAELHQKGQPTLVGTISIEVSEHLSRLLQRANIPHTVLNAKYHEHEADIVAQAGRKGGVTIATNMAGRGTDIVLGGNPEALARNLFQQRELEGKPLSEEEQKKVLAEFKARQEKEHAEVVEAGGLHVLGTERHEARRIDNQLRGRCGRQGDPGSSRFYLSLEDDLMRVFGSDRLSRVMERLGMEEGQDIQHPLVTKSIETAQKRVESHNFDIRKHLLAYDGVTNTQRLIVYGERRKILEGENLKEYIHELLEDIVEEQVAITLGENQHKEDWDLGALKEWAHNFAGVDLEIKEAQEREDIAEQMVEGLKVAYETKIQSLGVEVMRHMEKQVLLHVLDSKWKDHLYNMDQLREGIGLRGYGQRDPRVEYQHEGFDMFEEMISNVKTEAVSLLYRLAPATETRQTSVFESVPQQFIHAEASGFDPARGPASGAGGLMPPPQRPQGGAPQPFQREMAKVGRNDPCPCGSGKKFKKCHGA
ncbi:MAG: preprotein translocase subunit SecA [Candidatus Omnitrophica bacterium]|nr:preprotein translocase subunit SecA [Candidatus Omnitrophota bacterium]